MRFAWLIAGTVIAAAAPVAWAADDAAKAEVFEVLDTPSENQENTLGSAVGTFDRALGKYESGDLAAIRSNLGYNRSRLEQLKRQAAAQEKYVQTFWERVAVYFENLKARYGNDEANPAYRKAAISLKEEYEQREAGAKHELDRINNEIARVSDRIAELENREQMAQLEQELRANTLAAGGVAPDAEKKPVPSRADEAISVMSTLVKRKVERRVLRLVDSAAPRSTWDACFEELAESIRKGK